MPKRRNPRLPGQRPTCKICYQTGHDRNHCPTTGCVKKVKKAKKEEKKEKTLQEQIIDALREEIDGIQEAIAVLETHEEELGDELRDIQRELAAQQETEAWAINEAYENDRLYEHEFSELEKEKAELKEKAAALAFEYSIFVDVFEQDTPLDHLVEVYCKEAPWLCDKQAVIDVINKVYKRFGDRFGIKFIDLRIVDLEER